jgi:hypothetical protein
LRIHVNLPIKTVIPQNLRTAFFLADRKNYAKSDLFFSFKKNKSDSGQIRIFASKRKKANFPE